MRCFRWVMCRFGVWVLPRLLNRNDIGFENLGFRRKSAMTTSFERWTLYWMISRVVLFIGSARVGEFGIDIAAVGN